MRQFLKYILIGAIAFIIACIGVEFYQTRMINVYSYKYNYLQNQGDDIKTLLLGNSYLASSFDPAVLGDSVFDAAIAARWIYYDVQLLQRTIDKMSNLKQVIFAVGYSIPFRSSYHYPVFEAQRGKAFVDNQKYMYSKYMHIRYDKEPLPYYYWFGLFRNEINIKTLQDDIYFLQLLKDNYIGYEPTIGQAENWRDLDNIDSAIVNNQYAEEQVLEYSSYLEDLAGICNQHNVRFIIITPPCHNVYLANVQSRNVDIIHSMIDEVKVKYPVEYIDYLSDEEFREDSLYYNSSHLNSIGAVIFAKRVKIDFKL